MSMIFLLLQIAVTVVNVYMLLIFIRVLLTWVPSWSYSGFGRFMSALVDPYLNLFKGFKFLRAGMIDFSPIAGIGLLALFSTLCNQFLMTGRITAGIAFSVILTSVWSIANSLITFLLIFLAIRLIFEFFSSSSSFWAQMDSFVNPVAYKLAGMIFPRRFIQYRTVLITAIILLSFILFAGNWIINYLSFVLRGLPF